MWSDRGCVMSRIIHAFIFAFIVGGLVGYALSTSQALTAAAAVADAVPILDAQQVEITSPTPTLSCLPSQDMTNAGVQATRTETDTTEPPATGVAGSPIETPAEGHAATDRSCVPQPCVAPPTHRRAQHPNPLTERP